MVNELPSPIQPLRLKFSIEGPVPSPSGAVDLANALRSVHGALEAYVNLTTRAIAIRCDAAHCDPEEILATIHDADVVVGRASLG